MQSSFPKQAIQLDQSDQVTDQFADPPWKDEHLREIYDAHTSKAINDTAV